MSWVSIEREKCNNCGVCLVRCMRCFYKQNDDILVNANEDNCNLCGHCVSLCPTEAVVHHQMDMGNFSEVDHVLNFDTDQFIHFIRKRRSHRHFKKKEVPRVDLEKLVDVCRYAPTGSNRQSVEIKIIQDPDRIKQLSTMTLDFFVNAINLMEQEMERLKAQGEQVSKDLETQYQNISRYKTMQVAREANFDMIFHRAPVVMVFHSSRNATTPKDDCVIAAQTLSMTAMTMGLECCYIGLFTNASNNYPPIVEQLNLPPGNKVYSVLILGYPKLKFQKTVDRKPIQVTWE